MLIICILCVVGSCFFKFQKPVNTCISERLPSVLVSCNFVSKYDIGFVMPYSSRKEEMLVSDTEEKTGKRIFRKYNYEL